MQAKVGTGFNLKDPHWVTLPANKKKIVKPEVRGGAEWVLDHSKNIALAPV